MKALVFDNLHSGQSRGTASKHPMRRRAFSMTEMVFAIFILGLGLLFTSSMFPIAWFKARDVFETTNTQSCTAAAQNAFHRVSEVNGPNPLSTNASTFFPDDWFPADRNDPTKPIVFPNTRVHAMNLGNYKAEPHCGTFETDDLNIGGDDVPVGSSSWNLSDQLTYWMGDSAYVSTVIAPVLIKNRFYTASTFARDRLFPPMEERPDPADSTLDRARALWDEQFAGRRYCWSVLYRFSRMYGPDVSIDPLDPFNQVIGMNCAAALPTTQCTEAIEEVRQSLAKPRELTVYYVTLKRPDNARYAKQEGLIGAGGAATWDNSRRLDHPRALPVTSDVLLPSPWRFEASLTTVPAIGEAPTGIPSEIRVDDSLLADILIPKTVLIDERNGQIYRVTQRRNVTGNFASVVLVLDKEYTSSEVHRPNYTLFPKRYDGPESLHENWQNKWEWIERDCDNLDLTDGADPEVSGCLDIIEDEPEKRYYWVFPPPVDLERAGSGVPVFSGSPPVVDIQTRQVVLRPRQ